MNPTLLGVHNPANPLTELLLQAGGFHLKPKATIPVRPGLFALTWLGPHPIGLVPPHVYGLPEDYLFGIPKDVTELFFSSATDDDLGAQTKRLRLAQQVADELIELIDFTGVLSDQQLAEAAGRAALLLELARREPYIRDRLQLPVPSIQGTFERALEARQRARAFAASDLLRVPLPSREQLAAVGDLAVFFLQALQARNPADP